MDSGGTVKPDLNFDKDMFHILGWKTNQQNGLGLDFDVQSSFENDLVWVLNFPGQVLDYQKELLELAC